MPNTYWVAPTSNFVQTTLNGSITNSVTSITLNSTANLQAPGYLVIDRTDNNGTSTPNNREVITYTGVTSTQVTGAVRGADGSTARAHNDGAVVETVPTVGMWNSLTTIVSAAVDIQGLLLAIPSPVSVANMLSSVIYTSVASIGIANIGSRLDVSSASVTGLGLTPIFIGAGNYSGPTIAIGGLLIAPRAATLQYVSAVTKYVASGTSVGFDFQLRGASVFANATTRPAITAGGTYVSTASIATTNINRGDILQANVDSMLAGAGLITEVTIMGGGI